MRLIDADAMDKRRIDYIADGYAESVNDMTEWGMALIEAPTIGGWIPCSKRLPEMVHDELIGDFCNSDPCIITYERHGCRWVAEITFVYCSDGLWRYCPNAEDEVYMPINDDCSIVVAWMPIPAPWKEGESNG